MFEKIYLRRLLPVLEQKLVIPYHQLGFRNKHGTIDECHRVVSYMSKTAIENKNYCNAFQGNSKKKKNKKLVTTISRYRSEISHEHYAHIKVLYKNGSYQLARRFDTSSNSVNPS